MCFKKIGYGEIHHLLFSLDADCYSDRDCYHHGCDHGHISYCSSGTCHCKRMYIHSDDYDTYIREW